MLSLSSLSVASYRKSYLLAAAIMSLLVTAPAFASLELTKKYCIACHQLEKTGMGPSLMDISKKYQSDPFGSQKIIKAIQYGSKGVTGEGKVMAPMLGINAVDAKSIATYILSLATSKSNTLSPNFSTANPIITVSPSQCATYHPTRNPQVQIPCVQIRDGVVFSAGLNQVSPDKLRFVVEPNSVQQINTIPNETCSVLPLDFINRLYIGCLDLGSSKPWVVLDVSNTDPLTFDVVDYEKP